MKNNTNSISMDSFASSIFNFKHDYQIKEKQKQKQSLQQTQITGQPLLDLSLGSRGQDCLLSNHQMGLYCARYLKYEFGVNAMSHNENVGGFNVEIRGYVSNEEIVSSVLNTRN